MTTGRGQWPWSVPGGARREHRLLELGPSDILVDLGCGDARLLVAAASQRGVSRCYGVEYDGAVYRRAVARVAEQDAAVAERVRVRHGDALQAQAEVAAATAIFMYLVPTGMRAIAPQIIAAMRERGVRVVTYMFSLPGCEPRAVELYKGTKIYLYSEGGGGSGSGGGAVAVVGAGFLQLVRRVCAPGDPPVAK